jgi:hypothetical protein
MWIHRLSVSRSLESMPTTLMYCTGKAYDSGKPVFIEKDKRNKEKQKNLILKGSSW